MEPVLFADFSGKKIIVTGALSGIGNAICRELKKTKAQVVMVGRDQKRLEKEAAVIGIPKEHIIALDLTNSNDIQERIRDFTKDHGPIFGLCHSAGIVNTRPLNVLSVETMQEMFSVNLLAGIEMARAVCRREIMEKEGGSIVFIASVYASAGVPGEVGYSMTKGGLISAARTMAVELARRNIRVNTISPGLVWTKMTKEAFSLMSKERVKQIEASYPLGPGVPEDVARAAVFLLAPQNRWITGIDLIVDGGYTAK